MEQLFEIVAGLIAAPAGKLPFNQLVMLDAWFSHQGYTAGHHGWSYDISLSCGLVTPMIAGAQGQ